MDDSNKQGPNMKSNWQTITTPVVTAMLIFIVISSMGDYLDFKRCQELSYNEFVQMVEADGVDFTKVGSTEITAIPKKGSTKYSQNLDYYVVGLKGDYDFVNRMLDNSVITNREKSGSSTPLLVLLNYAVPFLLLLSLMNSTTKRMGGDGIMSAGKSNAKTYAQRETSITFKDVAGEDETKEPLIEIVDLLHNSGKCTKIGAELPKGALLVDPPGTGKTLLAKAVTDGAHMPSYSLPGSDFMGMLVGVGTSRVRDLFKNAAESAPCIIFADKIGAIGRSRNSRMGGNGERERTLSQLPSETDGSNSIEGLLVLGATNRPGILDPALLRPRRFDRCVVMDKPGLNGRVNILKVHSKDVLLDESVDSKEIVLTTSGVAGVDLTNMMNGAAINAVKRGRNAVSQEDLFETVEVVLMGEEKKDRIMSREERRIVPYHETGHALVSALQKHSEPVQKTTIVSRTMGALGYVVNVPEEEKYFSTKKELEAKLAELMAGHTAGKIVFEIVTTGAANDIQQTTSLTRAMVTQYGMPDKFDLMGLASQESQYLTGRAVLNCGDTTAAEIDQEIMKILKGSYDEAKHLLSDNKDTMGQIAAFLVDGETITDKEFMKVFHKVKGILEPEETKENEDKVRIL